MVRRAADQGDPAREGPAPSKPRLTLGVADHDLNQALLTREVQSPDFTLRRIEEQQILSFAWASAALAEQHALMDPNYWPYNVADNRPVAETAFRFAREQHMIPRPLAVEAVFSRTGEVHVVSDDDRLGPMDRVVAVHEYTHALQYQNFNLRRQRQAAGSNGDRTLALTTLLEGDATLMMIRYLLADFSQEEVQSIFTQAISRASGAGSPTRGRPRVLRETAMFPYTQGATFLLQVVGREAIRGEGYGEAENQLFAEPPQSTAQILHPERYLRGQAPERVRLGDPEAALGDGWHEVQRGVLGELCHRLLVQQHLRPQYATCDDDCADCDDYDDDPSVSRPGDRAARAAEGWAGDAYAFLESDSGAVALVLRTRWDDAAEAVEWLDTYAESLQGRYGDVPVALEATPDHHLWRRPDGMLALAGAGAETVLTLAPTAAQARLLAALPAAR